MSQYKPFKDDILRLLREGMPARQIARTLGCSIAAVMNYKRLAASSEAAQGEEGSQRSSQTPSTPEPESEPISERAVAGAGHERGRGLLWTIALDPSAPPAARVNAVDKLREIESWDFLVKRDDRALPPPLSRAELVQRVSTMLSCLDDDVILEALVPLNLPGFPVQGSLSRAK